MRSARTTVAAAGVLTLLTLPLSVFAQTPPQARDLVSPAQTLFEDASRKLDAGDFEHACPMLENVLQIEPGANGARLALAECYEGAGRLASARATYVAVAGAAAQLGQTQREKTAKERAAALEPRVGGVIVQVSAAVRAAPDWTLTLDGEPFSPSSLNKPFPLDKGPHELAATAAGKKRWTRTVQVSDGATVSVTVDALEDDTPPPLQKPLDPGPLPAPPPRPRGAPAESAPPAPSLSHRGQIGAFVRLDFDALSRGAVVAPGLSYAPHEGFEIGASALLGKRAGFELSVTCFFLPDRIKPFVTLAVPVLFQTDPYAGAKGAAGVLWDVNRHFGVLASVGGTYFPEVPSGYTHGALLPALGVQGRL